MSVGAAGLVRRRRVDGWRWTGRLFLALLLVFSVLPMIFEYSRSRWRGKAAAHP